MAFENQPVSTDRLKDPDGDAEGQSELGSTREFETAEGRLSYQELSERLAVPLVAIYDEILQSRPDQTHYHL